MIEVIIKDTDANHSKMINVVKKAYLSDGIIRQRFICSVNVMISEFMWELKDKAKESKKCQTGL